MWHNTRNRSAILSPKSKESYWHKAFRKVSWSLNTWQNGRGFAFDIFKLFFPYETWGILIKNFKLSCSQGQRCVHNPLSPTLGQVVARHRKRIWANYRLVYWLIHLSSGFGELSKLKRCVIPVRSIIQNLGWPHHCKYRALYGTSGRIVLVYITNWSSAQKVLWNTSYASCWIKYSWLMMRFLCEARIISYSFQIHATDKMTY